MSSKRLPELTDVKPLGPGDAAFLSDMREVLVRHGALERFGLTLLHDHFDMDVDELLVETCEPEARVLTIHPERAPAPGTGERLIATSWQFSPEGDVVAGLVCKLGCFVDLKDRHSKTHQRVRG